MAIAALILVFVFYRLGIVFGHVARRQIKRSREGGSGLGIVKLFENDCGAVDVSLFGGQI